MDQLLAFPIVLPFLVAMLLVVGRGCVRQDSVGWAWTERILAAVCVVSVWLLSLRFLWHVKSEGSLVLHMANWPPPFGIVLVADTLACIMLFFSLTVAVAVVFYSWQGVNETRQRVLYFPLMLILLGGVNWSFLTGDLFNLFVSYEVMLVASYVLVALGSEKEQLRGAFKYMTLNLVVSTFFLAGVGLLYGLTGTLNFADLSLRIAQVQDKGLIHVVSIMFLFVFAFKAAAFPLYAWLPESYPAVPWGINAYFSASLTKVGVYSLLRIFSLVFGLEDDFIRQLFIVLAGLTMLLGVWGALCQWEIRRVLSFHIISQVGYMLMGIGLFTPLAFAGTIFFIIHNMVVKSCLFLAGGLTGHFFGTTELKKLGGVVWVKPLAAFLFLAAGLAIAGVPPFSGFPGKFILIKAGLEGGHHVIVLVSVLTSLFTLMSMMKIWTYVYWGQQSSERRSQVSKPSWAMTPSVCLLVLVTLALGIGAQPILELTLRAGNELMNPATYIQAVLGSTR